MKEIKYQMNLTLCDETVLKAFETFEQNHQKLIIKFLASDIDKNALSKIFTSDNSDNFKKIYKTTTAGKMVCEFDNYIKMISITESLENIGVEVEKEVATTAEDIGADTITTTPTTAIATEIIDTPTEFVIVTLGYVSELEQKVTELENKLNELLRKQQS